MEWWVLSESSSSMPNGKFVVIQGTAAAVKAKYDGAVSGPYPTQAAAQKAANSRSGGFPGPSIPGNPATAIADLYHGLNLGNWIIRVGEILLGVILIGVGVAKLTGADNVVSKIAGSAGKLAFI